MAKRISSKENKRTELIDRLRVDSKFYCPVVSNGKVEIKTATLSQVTGDGRVLADCEWIGGKIVCKELFPADGFFVIGSKPGTWQPWFLTRGAATEFGREVVKQSRDY